MAELFDAYARILEGVAGDTAPGALPHPAGVGHSAVEWNSSGG